MRRNTLLFKTKRGATVGDTPASLIQICRLNGGKAWRYLAWIIRNKSDAQRNPHLSSTLELQGGWGGGACGLKTGQRKIAPGRGKGEPIDRNKIK
jgi:hypothetical protein